MKRVRHCNVLFCVLSGVILSANSMHCRAQITLAQATGLALSNSPRVKSAQNDLKKAQAGLALAKDMYIPSAVVGVGLGDAYGITLTVPTIFTITTQSVVFSLQQQAYVHGAHYDIKAAEQALAEVKQQVEEDTAITYLSLATAQQSATALKEQVGFAEQLAAVMQDRLQGGLESSLEVHKSERDLLQIKLAAMQANDSVEDLRGHLAELTGLSPASVDPIPNSVPPMPSQELPTDSFGSAPNTPGLLAAELNLKARQQRARGDAEYTWRPQIGFGATYGRVSPIENVSQFYNLHGNYNTASFGFAIQLPIVDRVRKAAADQSRLDADRAAMDLSSIQSDATAGFRKLQRSIPELKTRTELAEVNYSIAQDQLATAEEQSHHATGGPLVTPKDVINAHIGERQRYLELLGARLDERKTQITYSRFSGTLDQWIHSIPADPRATK